MSVKTRTFVRRGDFHVYMLECADGTFYTGYTNDLSKRLALHNKGGGSKYVKTRRPARLVFCKPYKYFKLAILEERRLKRLTRVQKEKIVESYAGTVDAAAFCVDVSLNKRVTSSVKARPRK